MTDKENITAILECYFPGFKEEIIESACNRILEQEPCEKFKQKAGVVIEQLRADRDRLATALEEIKAELHGTAEMHDDGEYYLREEWIDEVFDKHKGVEE